VRGREKQEEFGETKRAKERKPLSSVLGREWTFRGTATGRDESKDGQLERSSEQFTEKSKGMSGQKRRSQDERFRMTPKREVGTPVGKK